MKRLRALGLVIVAACTADLTDEQSADPPRLAGSAASDNSVLFIGAGDIASCSFASQDDATAALIQQYPSAQVFTLGDHAYPDGTAAQFKCYDASWGKFKSRTRPVPGNHDYHAVGQPEGAPGYYGYFGGAAGTPGKGYYAYTLGSWRIYAINSEISTSATSAQVAWLKADLKANPAQCILAYWHRPLFTSSSHHGGSTRTRPLWAALEAAGAEIILNGHEHHYERFAPQTSNGSASATGIRQFVAGGGGVPGFYNFLPTPAANSVVRHKGNGVLLFTLSPGGYTWKHLSPPGNSFTDSGSGACSGASTPPPPPPPPSSSISLTVSGRSDATKQYMTLDWTGASGTTMDVFRNGVRITNTANDGHYTNSRTFQGDATYTYRICEAGTSKCSNEATVSFGENPPPPPPPPPPPSSSSISLTVTGRSDATKHYMTLSWTGATSATVNVYRDGALRTTTSNDGHYVNSRSYVGAATYVYKLCETGSSSCSNEATVVVR